MFCLSEEYMRKYLLLRHMKRGDLAGLLSFLLSPAFEAREGELTMWHQTFGHETKMRLLRITVLDLLPAHRQHFIRQFFLSFKFDFPHQLLLHLIPDLEVELPKQNKRKAVSQEVILPFFKGIIFYSVIDQMCTSSEKINVHKNKCPFFFNADKNRWFSPKK